MKKAVLFLFLIALTARLPAQSGFTITPYFLTTGYGASLYAGEDNISGMPLGGTFHLNIKRKLMFDLTHMKMAAEVFSPGRRPYLSPFGNDSTAYTYRHFGNTELLVSFTIKWNNKDDKGEGYKGHTYVGRQRSIRAGVILNNRMVRVSPHMGTVKWYNGSSTPVDTVMPLTVYDITDLQQRSLSLGFAWKRYKVFENRWFGGGGDVYDRWGNRVGSIAPDPSKQLFNLRKRYWEKYIDILFAVSSRYGNYMNDTLSYSGSSIKNINPFGFRAGIKRACYNPISTQFLVEAGVYPGQKYDEQLDQWTTAPYRNWYIMGGFTMSFGGWFSAKEAERAKN